MLLDIIPTDSINSENISMPMLDRLFEQFLDQAIVLGQRLIIVVIVFFVGRWLIKVLRRLIDRFLERRKIEKTVKSFLDSLASITLKIVLFLLIANILGVSMTSFAAVLAAGGLAIGLAMKDNLSNFAGGVMLLINKPFKVGDRIVSQSMDGTVQAIGILYTVLITADNRTIFMPNGPLSTGSIINYSAQAQRRIDLLINLNYGVDVTNVKQIVRSIIASEKRINDTPSEPFVGITTLNNGTIDVTIRVWVATGDYGDVSVLLNEAIYDNFTQNGIYIPSSLSIRMLKD